MQARAIVFACPNAHALHSCQNEAEATAIGLMKIHTHTRTQMQSHRLTTISNRRVRVFFFFFFFVASYSHFRFCLLLLLYSRLFLFEPKANLGYIKKYGFAASVAGRYVCVWLPPAHSVIPSVRCPCIYEHSLLPRSILFGALEICARKNTPGNCNRKNSHILFHPQCVRLLAIHSYGELHTECNTFSHHRHSTHAIADCIERHQQSAGSFHSIIIWMWTNNGRWTMDAWRCQINKQPTTQNMHTQSAFNRCAVSIVFVLPHSSTYPPCMHT